MGQTSNRSVLNIIEFIDTINIRLFPMQRLIVKMQHGIELSPITDPIVIWDEIKSRKLAEFYHEQDALNYLYKNGYTNMRDVSEAKYINDEILTMGRRATKSTITTYINTSYDIYKLVSMPDIYDTYRLFENATIQMSVISNKKGNAEKQFNELKSAILSSPFLSAHYIPSNSTKVIRLKTLKAMREDNEAYGKLEIRIDVASESTRGGANIKIILDEIEYYIKAKNNPLDFKVYDSVTPSTATFVNRHTKQLDGKTVITTTPKTKQGLVYRLIQELRVDPEDDKSKFLPLSQSKTFFLTMPSHWVNPQISSDYLIKARNRSRVSFDIDIMAKFIDIKGSFLADTDVDLDALCSLKNDIANLKAISPNYVISLDLAVRTDRVPITVLDMFTEKEEVLGKTVTHRTARLLFQHTFWTTDKTYKTKKVFIYLHNLVKRLPQGKVVCVLDQYSFDIAMELVNELKSKYSNLRRIKFVEQTATDLQNHLEAELFLDYAIDNRLILIDDEEFKRELMLLEKEYTSRNYIKVEAPVGEHDDRYDGLVRALFWLNKNYNYRLTKASRSPSVAQNTKPKKDKILELAKRQNRGRKGFL